MAGIEGLIRIEDSGFISFGDYEAQTKQKIDNFELEGDVYKLKTSKEMTRLEMNGRLLYESVPGTNVYDFSLSEKELTFEVEGADDAQITVELEAEQEYKIFVEDILLGKMKSNLAGKLNISADFCKGTQAISIKKVK